MKKNQKILGMLLLTVVLLFTMCKHKKETDTDTTESEKKSVYVSKFITDSLINQITDSIKIPYDTATLTDPCTFRYLIRFNATSGITGYRSYLRINNTPPILITGTSQLKAIELTVEVGSTNTIHIYSLKNPLTGVASSDTLFSEKAFDVINSCDYPDMVYRNNINWRDIPTPESQITPYTPGTPGSVINQIVMWPPTINYPSFTFQHYKPL